MCLDSDSNSDTANGSDISRSPIVDLEDTESGLEFNRTLVHFILVDLPSLPRNFLEISYFAAFERVIISRTESSGNSVPRGAASHVVLILLSYP